MLGTKTCLIGCLLSSALCGFGILFYGQQHQDGQMFLGFVMGAKFGITMGFCIIYIAHTTIFPVMFAATSMGFCNLLARMVSIASPLVA